MKANIPALYPNEKVGTRVTEYAEARSGKLPEALLRYHAWVIEQEKSNLTISPFQAQGLLWLTRAIGAKRVLEIGVFRGFSSMVWSHAVGPGGKVTGLELDQEYADVARKGFADNGIANCEVIVGDALETLAALDPAEPYDLIFIDAQKSGYPKYLQTILDKSGTSAARRLLRPGGVIVADNVLRRGLVADASDDNPAAAQYRELSASGYSTDADLAALEEFNKALSSNPRIEAWLVPLFDGLGLGRLVD